MDTITIFILLSTLWFQHLTFSLDFSDYVSSSFTNPVQSLKFTHFTTHHETGTVYIGATDALYQLASDFTIQEKVDTAVSECEGDVNGCPNHNKILLIDYAHDRLISCGGENVGQPFGGTCKTRDLVDITIVLDNPDKQPVVASGILTTEAIIAPGVSGNNTLYVAATPDAKREEHVFILSRRNLVNYGEILLFNTEDEYTKLTLSSSFSSFYINYVSSFVTNGYTYFVTHQTITESNFISKIHRVCHNSNTFDSFTEITIECQGQNKTVYNLIQAAYVGAAGTDLVASLGVSDGDDVFYGVFAKSEASGNGYVPSMQSALCVFSLQDIENSFFEAVAGCVGGNDNMGMSSVDHQVNYLHRSEGGCPGHSVTDTQVRGQICTAINWKYAKSIIPLESDAVIEWSDAIPSSIITATHRQHTIAFVGTTKGNMIKVHVMDKANGREYERFSVANHVLRDVEIDKEELTILTTQKLLRLRVENCIQYKSCDECIGVNGEQDGDPYCGWCTLEKRCTRYNACFFSNTTSRWLSYNSSKCIVISKVTPYDRLPVTETEQRITMMVEQLPGLSIGNSYQCIFGDLSPVPASKINTELTCTAPAKSKLPKIQSNADYLNIQLYVYSTETKLMFVQRDIFFYECNTHQGCVACTNSSWACDWCIYSNKCVHDNSTCSDDNPSSIINGINNPEISNKQGYQECPQLAVQNEEILVPDGISKPINVTGLNLPDENKATSYTCILNIEGDESKTDAIRSGNMFTCEARMYTYMANVSDLNVALYVVWENNRRLDDVHGFIVTLYKCDVGRPDCSRCLSNLSTRPELNCGWCSVKCTVQGSSDCSAGWMSSATNVNCPNPYLLEVQPSSGPLNGNTTIVISGTDLGKQFSDVTTIKVGTKNCNKNGLEDRYMAGSSVSCRTMSGTNNSVEDITVTIRGANGDLQESTGEVQFTYRDPSISSFEPREGLTAGGTVVTISGQYMDACSEISATIGSECIMNRMDDVINATTAYCRSTRSPVGASHKLTLSFDGTNKQSEDTFTYRPNPVVSAVQPLKTIESGGITLMVEGTGFELAQTPQLVMYVVDEQFIEDCVVRNNTMMLCQTPNIKDKSENISRQKREARGKASFGFVIGNVTDLLKWSDDNNASMEYYDDPKYEQFGTNPQLKQEDILLINGSNLNDGSSKIDVIVYIGKEKAVTTSLANRVLTIELPKINLERVCINGNTTAYPCVVVYHGNLVFYIGTIRYPSPTSLGALIGSALSCIVLLIVVVALLFFIRWKVKGQKKDLHKLGLEMMEIEENIADDIKTAFVQLQTDVSDLTRDLEGVGMPFVPHRQYAMSMFFTGLNIQPMAYDPEDSEVRETRAMLELSKLISNKQFLMAFILIVDEDKSIPNKDKVTIGSLLSVLMILEYKLSYLTDVMITLMSGQVQDAVEAGKPNKPFQRTETIIEKLLSNWIALSLYDFLKNDTAYPLFLLYRAIKCQSEKGPIDAISGKSHLSLSDENIISEPLEFQTLTLQVIVNEMDGEKKEVTVLDVNTITQVKSKILDSIHRNRAYSHRIEPSQVALEWRSGESDHRILQDIDGSSEVESGWKKINTLKHFNVPDGAVVAIIPKKEIHYFTREEVATQHSDNMKRSRKHSGISQGAIEYPVEVGVQLWHLVKQEDEDLYMSFKKKKKKYKRSMRHRKCVREITFSRILGTKGTVQEYMDGMFAAILNIEKVPLGIKYIFDFFDGLAVRYNIQDDSIVHTWKSNILPLRFWQKIISNPQYIFDINQSQCVEASLSVISQAFYDAFRRNPDKLSKDASYRKLLYNHEIPDYRKLVEKYYSSILQMPRVSKLSLDKDLKEICNKFMGLFSHLSTLLELYKLIVKYKSKLVDAFTFNEDYQDTNLLEKLEQVMMMLDNSGMASGEPGYS